MEANREVPGERRRLSRHTVNTCIDVVDKHSGRTLGMVVNIHEEGLLLFGDPNLQLNKIYPARLEASGSTAASSLDVELQCRWKQGEDGDSSRWAGFQIINPPTEIHDAISRLHQAC